jgi:hypothetical protein
VGEFVGEEAFLSGRADGRLPGGLDAGERRADVFAGKDKTVLAILMHDHFAWLHDADPATAIRVYCRLGACPTLS